MKKKVLSLLLAVVMTFSLAVTANAAEETAQDLDGDIVILHTNDVHGAISGYAKVAALKDAYEARGAYVLLMDVDGDCGGFNLQWAWSSALIAARHIQKQWEEEP